MAKVSKLRPQDEGRTAQFVRFWLERRPDLDADALAIELSLARINLMARKSMARAAQTQDLSPTDFRVMGAIHRGRPEGLLRPSDLWKLFDLTPSAITYQIGKLVRRGLVTRSLEPDDRRVILLSLTPAGLAKVDAVMTVLARQMRDRLGSLDAAAPAGRRTLLSLLALLARQWDLTEADDAYAPDPDQAAQRGP